MINVDADANGKPLSPLIYGAKRFHRAVVW
jgi:hypothetical protein